MAWRDTLAEIKEELAEVRAERLRQAEQEEAELRQTRDEISRLADSLGISGLLSEMNTTLLGGGGEIETIVSWDTSSDGAEEEDGEPDSLEDEDEDEGDVITTVLSWEEGGEREIAVDVASTGEGASVQINGVEVRPERDALEQALIEAFRDELEL